jgi:hypothetical protein
MPAFPRGENVKENDHTPATCTVCRKEIARGEDHNFGGAPVCRSCADQLDLKGLDTTGSDEVLSGLLEDQGRAVLGEFTALSRSIPSDFGWNILGLLNTITDEIEDVQSQTLLESAMIICGLTAVRLGEGEGDVDPGLLSLYLVLGQVMDLSIMRRIVLDGKLRTSNKFDELKLIGDHNRVIFDLVTEIPHGEDPTKEMLLSNCLERVV